jgi:hypothetical protein
MGDERLQQQSSCRVDLVQGRAHRFVLSQLTLDFTQNHAHPAKSSILCILQFTKHLDECTNLACSDEGRKEEGLKDRAGRRLVGEVAEMEQLRDNTPRAKWLSQLFHKKLLSLLSLCSLSTASEHSLDHRGSSYDPPPSFH